MTSNQKRNKEEIQNQLENKVEMAINNIFINNYLKCQRKSLQHAAYKRFTLGQKTPKVRGWEKDAHAKGNDKKAGSHTRIRQNRLTQMP